MDTEGRATRIVLCISCGQGKTASREHVSLCRNGNRTALSHTEIAAQWGDPANAEDYKKCPGQGSAMKRRKKGDGKETGRPRVSEDTPRPPCTRI